MTALAFIDANVIADWIVLSKILQSKTGGQREEFLRNYESMNPRLHNAYIFLQAVVENKFAEKKFAISPLCFVETVSALLKKAIYDYMYLRGIPFEDYPTYWKQSGIMESDLDAIRESANHYLAQLESHVHIWTPDSERSKIATKKGVDYLISLRLRTHDAVLLGEAHAMGATHFITTDKRLIDSCKAAGWKDIVVINPKHYFLEHRT